MSTGRVAPWLTGVRLPFPLIANTSMWLVAGGGGTFGSLTYRNLPSALTASSVGLPGPRSVCPRRVSVPPEPTRYVVRAPAPVPMPLGGPRIGAVDNVLVTNANLPSLLRTSQHAP